MNKRIYDPNRLVDALVERLQLKRDVELARMLGVSAPSISHFRRGFKPVGAAMLLRMSDISGISISEIRELMGDRRTKYRLSEIAWTDEERAERLGRAHNAAESTDAVKEVA